MPGNTTQTRNQIRAKKAYGFVSLPETKAEKNYPKLARKFPALAHNCGLAQAIAFVRAKEGNTGTMYLNHLSSVMDGPKNDLDERSLDERSREASLSEYQLLSQEAIEAATWLKRYAEALLDKGSGQDGSAETPPESESS